MKRFLAFVFALALCLSVFVGCGDKPNPDKPKANPLDLAKEYLYTRTPPLPLQRTTRW